MIHDKQIAAQVCEKALEANRVLNDALIIAQERCSPSEFGAVRLAIGQVLGELLLGVMNPIYQEHPDIKPEGLIVPQA